MKKILLQIFLILNLCLVLQCSGIISAEPGESDSSERYEFFLKPKTGVMQLFLSQDMSKTATTFIKEPNFGRGKIIRNSFPIPGKALPFAWDKRAAKLYIDFNRNLDLTDDPDNVFEAAEKKFAHIFRDIPIDVVIKDTPVRHFVVIQLYLSSRQLYGYMEVKTSWSGDIDLPHIKTRMMVTDDLNGEIGFNQNGRSSGSDLYSFIPLDFKDHPTSYPVQSFVNKERLSLYKSIFLNGKAYDLDYEFVKNEGEVLLKVAFTETYPDTGTLRFPGDSIKQVVLNGDYHAILFSPSKEEKIPAGSYRNSRIYLQKDPSGTELNTNVMNSFSFKDGEFYILKAGAPLKNKISISRMGSRLNIGYELSGIGGETYQRYDYQNPPEFTVFQGDKKIFSEKFTFG